MYVAIRRAPSAAMFALLAPAGFAVICKIGASIGDAHNKHRQACEKQRACNEMRGAAASMLPDADVELWRSRAVVATERIKGLESIITEMTRKLDEEERLREEAEEVAGEKLLEIDELKSEKEAVEAEAATREAALIASASEREAMLVRNAAEREAALQATAAARAAEAAAATTAAEAASNALFCVSDSILRWREELVVASLEADNYGAVPSAQQVLDVVANMEHEVEISVVLADALPTELRNKLLAKKNEQVRRKRLEARVGDNWTYGVRSVMDAPERLARLVNAAGASTSAPSAAQRPAAQLPQQTFSRIRTPPKSGKENASAFPPAMPAAAGSGGRPLEAMISNAMDLATKAMKPAKAAPKAASMELPAFNVLMPGELPGGPAPELAAPLKTYKSVPKAKRGSMNRVAGDRRSQVAAIASAFDDEPAVPQPMLRAVAIR